ncbi:MAG TPA: DUF2474 domain-containing protein [Roseateles sp.]
MPGQPVLPTRHLWLRRVGWLTIIWLASVLALGVAALAMKLVMRQLGLS